MTAPDLYARIDGNYVPLTECAWMLRAFGCNCVVGVAIAQTKNRACATEGEAYALFGDDDGDTEELRRAGYTVELAIIANARDAFTVECTHPGKAS